MSRNKPWLSGVVIIPEALRAQWMAENLAAETRFAAARAREDAERRVAARTSLVQAPLTHEDLPVEALVAASCACGPDCTCCAPQARVAA